jgi:hypothetical protein
MATVLGSHTTGLNREDVVRLQRAFGDAAVVYDLSELIPSPNVKPPPAYIVHIRDSRVRDVLEVLDVDDVVELKILSGFRRTTKTHKNVVYTREPVIVNVGWFHGTNLISETVQIRLLENDALVLSDYASGLKPVLGQLYLRREIFPELNE